MPLGNRRGGWHHCCWSAGLQCGTKQDCWSKCRLWAGNKLVGHPADRVLTCRLWGLQWLNGTVMEKHRMPEGCCPGPGDDIVTSSIEQTGTECLSSHTHWMDSHPMVLLWWLEDKKKLYHWWEVKKPRHHCAACFELNANNSMLKQCLQYVMVWSPFHPASYVMLHKITKHRLVCKTPVLGKNTNVSWWWWSALG